MIKAYHTTPKDAYESIKADGYIRPRRRLREFGERGYGFAPDWLAGDSEYVFFSVADFYRNLGQDGTDETFGFVFDAELLIYEFHGSVGPDLVHAYDRLLDKIAKEIDLTLKAKPVDDAAVQEFCEQMEITDPCSIEAIKKDEASHYQDILEGMQARDESVPGVSAALRLFDKRVSILRASRRKVGDAALVLLKHASDRLEILVKREVPLTFTHGEIIKGKEIIKNR